MHGLSPGTSPPPVRMPNFILRSLDRLAREISPRKDLLQPTTGTFFHLTPWPPLRGEQALTGRAVAEGPSATLRAASHGVEDLGDVGSYAPPISQEYPPLPLQELQGSGTASCRGRGKGWGSNVRSLSSASGYCNRSRSTATIPSPSRIVSWAKRSLQKPVVEFGNSRWYCREASKTWKTKRSTPGDDSSSPGTRLIRRASRWVSPVEANRIVKRRGSGAPGPRIPG